MSERSLVLRFDAPIQSWGVGAKGTVKTTQREPSFSGVLGLAANALGWDRSDDLSPLLGLRFATRTDRSGQPMRDYFTAGTTTGIAKRSEVVKDGRRTYKDEVDPNGVVGIKHYLSGSVFTVALSGEDEVLERLHAAFTRPARALYLGRKSCPVTRNPSLGMVDGGPEELLRSYPLDAGLVPPDNHSEGNWGRQSDLYADARIRLVLPARPDEVGAVPRFDVPTTFNSIHRHFEARYVRIEHVDRESLYPEKEVSDE